MQRCYNPQNTSYRYYGARGIDVYQEWHQFIPYFNDVGLPPSPSHSIERIDNSRGYSKDNCRWATAKEQARNRRNTRLLTWNNKTQCIKDWADEFHIKPVTVYARLYRGLSLEQALSNR